MRNILLIHYSEIGTKGKNRAYFERCLKDDIARRLVPDQISKVRLESGRLVAELVPGFSADKIHATFRRIFGVAWYAFATVTSRDLPAIEETAFECARQAMEQDPSVKSFKVYCRRADKTYPHMSQDICVRLGGLISEKFGLKVDLHHHDLAVRIEILKDAACVYGKTYRGQRGMPARTSGHMLCLFSGGIDSPVAAWSLMRRGGIVHYLHFHPFRSADEVKESKIFSQFAVMREYNPTARLYLIPHDSYQVRASLGVPTDCETVLFRRFMFRTAQRLAYKRRMKALITGDCLGQVASQTLENLVAARTSLDMPLFSPLISWDKEDVVNKAREIGTYELSIQPYKDCCSLMSRHPSTSVPVKKVLEWEQKLDFDSLINESLQSLEVWDGETLAKGKV